MYKLILVCATVSVGARKYEVQRQSQTDDVTTFIQSFGYPAELHRATTDDGFVLTIHRIPYGKSSANTPAQKHAVFFQHGLLCSSADFLTLGPERSAPFIFADQGYDVWLGNFRGNKYSMYNHVLNASDEKFWDYSFHEIGYYDIPAMVDYILLSTGQNRLFYVGHSQGTTSFWVMNSERPEYNDKFHLMIALAPIAYLGRMPNRFVRFAASVVFYFTDFFYNAQIMSYMPQFDMNLTNTCSDDSVFQELCAIPIFFACGWDSPQLNRSALSTIWTFFPGGSNAKQILHFAQLVHTGAFQKYDYGLQQNFMHYGQWTSPKYAIEKITAPVALYYGSNDNVDAEADVLQLSEKLSNVVHIHKIPYKKFNHADFLWGKDNVEMVYQNVFDLMKIYKNVQGDRQLSFKKSLSLEHC